MADESDVAEPVHLCDASSEGEAILIVNLLTDDGVAAHADAAPVNAVFGGLPFESGRAVYVQPQHVRKAVKILSSYPHFHNLKNVHQPAGD